MCGVIVRLPGLGRRAHSHSFFPLHNLLLRSPQLFCRGEFSASRANPIDAVLEGAARVEEEQLRSSPVLRPGLLYSQVVSLVLSLKHKVPSLLPSPTPAKGSRCQPDVFSVSQNWDWKLSSLRTEEYTKVGGCHLALDVESADDGHRCTGAF